MQVVAGHEIGALIDRRYRLKREIARGGVGVVYEAEHVFTKRSVAIKLLTPEHVNVGESRERLLREAHALSVARHPGVVAGLDAGEAEDGSPFVVMELLEGRTLDGILAVRGKITVLEALYVGQQICAAMAVAHDRGVLHRDIKPSNLFISRDDDGREIAKLFDFGIANLPVLDRKLTQAGSILGTPEYMAPEQLLAQENLDHRCDIYAIGVTLYECLAGVVPFEGNFGEVLLKSSTQPVPPLRERCPLASAELVAVIETSLAREPAHRYASARAMLEALRRVQPATPPSSFLGVRNAPPPLPLRAHPPPLPPSAPSSHGAAPPVEGRRRFTRAPYVTHLSIRRDKGGPIDARSEDISLGGMLVIPKVLCGEAESIAVVFALPITGQIVEVAAISRWIKSARSRQAMGVEFAALPPHAVEEIERYVHLMGAREA
jgi:eukaryotic-like serine/threonine-protein kinase